MLVCALILCVFVISGCFDGVSFSGNQTASQDWTLFRGDASLSGFTKMKLPDNPTLLWSYKSDSRTASSPLVKNGTVYWCDKRGKIYGINDIGTLAFEYDMNTAVEATPMIDDSVLYIGRIDGFMTAISLNTKDILWNFETLGQVSASPNSVDFEGKKAIVFGSYDNYLYCIDSRNGKKISQFESGYYINGSVALMEQHVIFGGCDAWVRVINTITGIATDSIQLDAYVPASPAIDGNYCYIADYTGNIYEILLENGKIVRLQKIMTSSDENSAFTSMPAVSDKMLFVLSGDRHVYAIRRNDGVVQWKFLQKGNSGESSPVVCADKVISCTKTGIVSILDTKTGALLWEYDAGEQIVASPAIIKNRFFILTAKGTLLCFGKTA